MAAKAGEKVVGAKGGGGATEAVAANPIAKAVRTQLAAKLAAESLVLPGRKLVKKMMWDNMVQAINKKKKKKNQNKIFPA